LHVQVRHTDDGLRRIKVWRNSRRPSITEIRVLARDAGFTQWHHEYPPSGFAVIILEDHDTVQDAEIERAAKARGDLRASERGRLEEALMKLWAELHRVHPDNLDGYRELWRMRFEQESLDWVRAELDAARVAIKRDGLRKPENSSQTVFSLNRR
jgi:hypothetical protein